jgi:hypothetical protein
MSKIKQHFKKHKTIYIAGGSSIFFAGITYLIMRDLRGGRIHDQITGADVFTTNLNKVSHSFVSESFNVTTNNYHGVDRLSYIVSQNGTDNWWRSQADAAKALNISEAALSKHLNHGDSIIGRPDLSFTREGVISAV